MPQNRSHVHRLEAISLGDNQLFVSLHCVSLECLTVFALYYYSQGCLCVHCAIFQDIRSEWSEDTSNQVTWWQCCYNVAICYKHSEHCSKLKRSSLLCLRLVSKQKKQISIWYKPDDGNAATMLSFSTNQMATLYQCCHQVTCLLGLREPMSSLLTCTNVCLSNLTDSLTGFGFNQFCVEEHVQRIHYWSHNNIITVTILAYLTVQDVHQQS